MTGHQDGSKIRVRHPFSVAARVVTLVGAVVGTACQETAKPRGGDDLDSARRTEGIVRAPADLSPENILQPGSWAHAAETPVFADSLPDDPKSPPVPPTPDIPDRWKTRARLMWGEQHLFVLVDSQGPSPEMGLENKDGPLHEGDVCEVFLDVGGKGQDIIEVQVGPTGRTATYHHHWDTPPTYPADRLNDNFYRAHHHVYSTWILEGLQARSSVTSAGNETRWLAAFIIPVAPALRHAGMAPVLHAGQTLRVNVLRYAYARQDGKPVFRQYNLVPTKHGCPHQSPMAMMSFTMADHGRTSPVKD